MTVESALRSAAQTAVTRLTALLALCFPGDPHPDIITLGNIRYRYERHRPDEGLPLTALRAMEQSQRIIRSVGNYRQIGLGEFHVGLIYLDHVDLHGAAQQFAEARRQWIFADHIPAVCLSYFAAGWALELGLHHEAAMTCYGKADQWLARAAFDADRLDMLRSLAAQVSQAQKDLRDRMQQFWVEYAAQNAAQAESAPVPAEPVPPVPMPVIRAEPAPVRPGAVAEEDTPDIPIGEGYEWFQVMGRANDDFLPHIRPFAWLRVQTRPRPTIQPGELLVIGGDPPLQGCIITRSPHPRPTFSRIYLARLLEWPEMYEFPFVRNPDNGEVTLGNIKLRVDKNRDLRVPANTVLGLVVGFWQELPIEA